MKILKTLKIIVVTFSLLLISSCSIEDGVDLNGPQTPSIADGVSRAEVPQVVAGILSDMRDRLGTQIDAISVLGRDYWRHQGSDPRWVADVLAGDMDDNTFYTTAPYASRYATVKECNLLLEGLQNTTADFTDAERAAIRGFANTIKAYELLTVLGMQYENGIRTEVSDPNNLGPFESYDDALSTIIDLLNSAAADLALGGDVSPNTLGVSYYEFNRAITARAAAYQGDYNLVLSALGDSFMDLFGDLNAGAYLQFSATGADVLNPLFFALNASEANARIAHPDFIASAEAGDSRVDKAVLRNSPLGVNTPTGELIGSYDVYIYQSNIDPVAIIRNEELLLLYAEANMVSNPVEAEQAINIVRNLSGLPDIPPGSVNEDRILYERRYSLFAEGHRWIDMRRFGRLDQLVLDRPGDVVADRIPRPQNENE